MATTTTTTTAIHTRVCDVPIDLDENYEGEEERNITIVANSSAVACNRGRSSSESSQEEEICPSSWSSSSGSFYDDLETSPIDMGAKWYWHSTTDTDLGLGQGGGYLSQSTGFDEDEKSKTVKLEQQTTACNMSGPNAQIFLRSVWNRDTHGHHDVMAKRMQSNREIELVQYLNMPVLRCDPWNPAPPLQSIVNDDNNSDNNGDADEPLAIFEPLIAYDSKPFDTVEEALDFVMQLLQGLVFLHENRVIHGDIHGKIIMMDHGCAQTSGEEQQEQEQEQGGRVQRNVRYYLVDFTHASIVDGQNDYLFQEDLRDLGLMIDRALGNSVPELSNIVLEMTSLCKSTHDRNAAPCASRVLENLEAVISEMTAERIKEPLLNTTA